jgi:hypothetical protein
MFGTDLCGRSSAVSLPPACRRGPFGARLFHPDQLRGRAIRLRPENDGIRDAEGRSARAYPEPQNDTHRRRK